MRSINGIEVTGKNGHIHFFILHYNGGEVEAYLQPTHKADKDRRINIDLLNREHKALLQYHIDMLESGESDLWSEWNYTNRMKS